MDPPYDVRDPVSRPRRFSDDPSREIDPPYDVRDPTDDPGSDIDLGLGSLFRDSLFTEGDFFTDGGSLFTELLEDEIVPPYRGGVLARECMDIRLESSDIARAEGES
jgi:hypothetical protein